MARVVDHRAIVDTRYRAYAIDEAYEKVRDIERGTVTPAMKRIEAEDPERHLAGLEFRLKGRDRLAEKIHEAMTERARTVDQAAATIKDAVRYTFRYTDDRYTEGVYADCERLERAGFGHVDRRNSWDAEEYKGINSRWQVPGSVSFLRFSFIHRRVWTRRRRLTGLMRNSAIQGHRKLSRKGCPHTSAR